MSIGSAQDDTADVEYTRAIPQELKNAKPRRLSTFQRRPRKDAGITIFEDVAEDQELVIAESRREIGGSTLLGKAARKMPRSNMSRQQETSSEEAPAQEDVRSKRRASTLADSIPGLRFKMAEPAKEAPPDVKPQGGLKKDPRRRTIFVPSDDTTVMTIHPGANTTDRLNDTFQLPNVRPAAPAVSETVDSPQGKASPKAAARRPRMSLAVAPKRLPLQHMAAEKGNVPAVDIPGQNGGKENLPPRSQVSAGDKKPVSRLFAPTAASQARGSVQARKAIQAPSNLQRSRTMAPSNTGIPRTSIVEAKQSRLTSSNQRFGSQQRVPALVEGRKTTVSSRTTLAPRQTSSATNPMAPPARSTTLPTKRTSPIQRSNFAEFKASKLQQYAVLSGDLAQPDLYEDDWLRHQEIALTELVNQIFSGAERKEDEWHDSSMNLQDRLVEIYHQPHVSTLHQRLQASLQYGALSIPRDANPIRVSQDIGLRKRFLNLWLDSYDTKLLRAAAEVVVGRQIPQTRVSGAVRSIESDMDPHQGRRSLIGFLETFFVDVQDAQVEQDAESGRWRKMISRSLMLVWLLEQAKTTHAISGCLFKTLSLHKTSAQILEMLAAIALPSSIGDISRALGHCDYTYSHEQDPLDEVNYHILNMATDMRDGVFLTKLVEILLHPTEPNTLSKHLKMPCLGRAQKLYNADVALSALDGRGSLGEILATADDVVNGHREKTLGLLWSLVSTYGLDLLVDFRELVKEIQRHDQGASVPQDLQYLAQHQQEELLQTWATALCAEKDVQVSNLTTSFADGRAYASIVQTFAPFCKIPKSPTRNSESHSASRSTAHAENSCASHLRALGCSTAFITSLTSTCTISNRQTTLSNLAFLASRLLPLKRRHNAAVTIQRAYRLRRAKVVTSQRVALMRVAHACATVVQTRNRLVDAATVLQRAWRGVLAARIGRLNEDVEGFQVLARGWLARRRLVATRQGVQSRVMGGW